MRQASELIAKQVGSAINNQKTWGSVIYNVQDPQYGAVGNGTKDDTNPVQKAMNTAIANNATLVFFPPGTYKVTTLTNVDKVSFVGDNAKFVGDMWTIEQFGVVTGNVEAEFDALSTKITNNTVAIGYKADISYVDAKVAAVPTGTPKGVYATVSALTAAFPSGNSNIYVVSADGKWYFWSGSAWTAGSVYQSTALADLSVTPNKTSFISQDYNLFNKATVTSGIMNSSNGTIVANSSYYASDYIPVTEGKLYKFLPHFDTAYFNSSNVYVSGSTAFGDLTIPSGVGIVSMRTTIAVSALETFMVTDGHMSLTYIPYGQTKINITDSKFKTMLNENTSVAPSKWTGKVWNVIGDSITEHNAKTTKNYQDYIADKIMCTVNNYGQSGTGWFNDWTTNVAFFKRLGALSSSADLITVFGGTNDWGETGKPLVMGTFGDTDPNATFYGAVDYTITHLVTQFPTKTIAVFTPSPRNNSWGTSSTGITLEQVTDAIIKVCKKYSVPVLDLYRVSNMYAWDSSYRTYAMPDGLHPNDNGHKALADKILAFLNAL